MTQLATPTPPAAAMPVAPPAAEEEKPPKTLAERVAEDFMGICREQIAKGRELERLVKLARENGQTDLLSDLEENLGISDVKVYGYREAAARVKEFGQKAIDEAVAARRRKK